MNQKLNFMALGLLAIVLFGCGIQTPEIKGVVLDGETKQPVENAWVTAFIEMESKTVAGGVHQTLFVGKTRSGIRGEFVIPEKWFQTQLSEMTFWKRIESISVGARATTAKGYISDGLNVNLEKNGKQVTLELKPPKDWMYYRSAIHSLYDYMLTGKLGNARTAIPEHERMEVLDLSIKAAEGYISQIGEGTTKEEKDGYAGVMKNLGYLYSLKGDYEKAIKIFQELIEFDEKRNVNIFLEEYKKQIQKMQIN